MNILLGKASPPQSHAKVATGCVTDTQGNFPY